MIYTSNTTSVNPNAIYLPLSFTDDSAIKTINTQLNSDASKTLLSQFKLLAKLEQQHNDYTSPGGRNEKLSVYLHLWLLNSYVQFEEQASMERLEVVVNVDLEKWLASANKFFSEPTLLKVLVDSILSRGSVSEKSKQVVAEVERNFLPKKFSQTRVISLEGPERSGKTPITRLMRDRLNAFGKSVLIVSDSNLSFSGEDAELNFQQLTYCSESKKFFDLYTKVSSIQSAAISLVSETLKSNLPRTINVLLSFGMIRIMTNELIEDSCKLVDVVIQDRNYISTFCYTHKILGLDRSMFVVDSILTQNYFPCYNIFCMISVEESMRRVEAEGDKYLFELKADFVQKAAEAYHELFNTNTSLLQVNSVWVDTTLKSSNNEVILKLLPYFLT